MKKDTIDRILKFRDDRNWKQFHNPKDLAISISLEASELLEIFQWSGDDTDCSDKTDKIREELADVINYCILMADCCKLDLDEIINEARDIINSLAHVKRDFISTQFKEIPIEAIQLSSTSRTEELLICMHDLNINTIGDLLKIPPRELAWKKYLGTGGVVEVQHFLKNTYLIDWV